MKAPAGADGGGDERDAPPKPDLSKFKDFGTLVL